MALIQVVDPIAIGSDSARASRMVDMLIGTVTVPICANVIMIANPRPYEASETVLASIYDGVSTWSSV